MSNQTINRWDSCCEYLIFCIIMRYCWIIHFAVQFVYIIILIGQMHKKDIQVKPCQVFYFKLTPCESSVKFPGHFKNKTNSRNNPTHIHTRTGIHLHTYTHTKYIANTWSWNYLCTAETLCASCRLFFMQVRLELGSFSVSIFFLALQKAHRNTCKGAFQLTAGPCSIPEQVKTKEALGSVTNGGVDRWISHCIHSGKKPKVYPCWFSWMKC